MISNMNQVTDLVVDRNNHSSISCHSKTILEAVIFNSSPLNLELRLLHQQVIASTADFSKNVSIDEDIKERLYPSYLIILKVESNKTLSRKKNDMPIEINYIYAEILSYYGASYEVLITMC